MKKQILIIIAIIAMITAPFLINRNATFDSGSDDQLKDVVMELNPEFEPWFSNIWDDQSGEIATLLFSLQAAIGAAVIGYYLGLMKGKQISAKNN